MALDIVGPANAPNSTTIRPADSRTFGATDTWVKDCSSPAANDGTKIQAGWLNGVIGQLRNAIRGNGLTAGSADIVTQNNADDSMLLKAMQHLIQRAQPSYAADTGTVNHIVAAFSPAVVEHKAGLVVRVKILNTNTGATDFAPNGLAVKSITRFAGGTLQPGDLQANGMVELAYDGTQYQIISGLAPPAGGSTQAAPRLVGIVATASATSVPTSVATRVNFNNTVQSNLTGQTTTWNGNTVTVGTGEGGLWLVKACTHFASPVGGVYCSTSIFVNGTEVAVGSISAGNSGDAQDPTVADIVKVAAGQTIEARAYQQTGSTQSVVTDNRSRFSAFLISSY